jgi:hypothetical protein
MLQRGKVTIRATVKLYAVRSSDGAPQTFEVELPEKSTLKDVLSHVTSGAAKAGVPVVDGTRRSWDYPLENGDCIGIYPLLAGG